MSIAVTGNINGPEGVFKTYGDLPQGGTFVFSVQDVSNNVFWIKSTAGAVGVNGSVQTVAPTQSVVEVSVTATVTV